MFGYFHLALAVPFREMKEAASAAVDEQAQRCIGDAPCAACIAAASVVYDVFSEQRVIGVPSSKRSSKS